MTYKEALAYMESLGSFGMMLGLVRIQKLLGVLGDPQKDLKIIHIGGTNGKGSVGAFLSAVLQKAGYKVGRFVSPAVFAYTERIQIDGQWIDAEAFAEAVGKIKRACEDLVHEGIEQPTQFEADTALALSYFKDTACDYVLLEVGLGGLMDATNAIGASLMSVLASIGLDHTRVLGSTLEEIAVQKAGIIKPGQCVVTAPQAPEVMQVLKARCDACGARLIRVQEPKLWPQASMEAPGSGTPMIQCFSDEAYERLEISLLGAYQPINAAVAVKAAQVLAMVDGAHIDDSHIREGLKAARWPGRFEVFFLEDKGESFLVVDGAHNPDGAQALLASVDKYFKGYEKILVMGVFGDKDYERILKIMEPCGDILIAHKPCGPRGLAGDILGDCAKKYFSQVYVETDVVKAIKRARAMDMQKKVIIAFGSLSTIGPLYKAMGLSLEGDTCRILW